MQGYGNQIGGQLGNQIGTNPMMNMYGSNPMTSQMNMYQQGYQQQNVYQQRKSNTPFDL